VPHGGSWQTAWPLVRTLAPSVVPLLGRHFLTRDEVEAFPARQQILEAVGRHPGISVSQLRREVGLGWGAFYHHLKKLRSLGLVRLRYVGAYRMAFLPKTAAEGDASAFAALQHETTRKVALAILRCPRTTIKQIVEATGESPRVVYYHVKQLLDGGLILSGSKTRHVDLRPSPQLRALMAALGAGRTKGDEENGARRR